MGDADYFVQLLQRNDISGKVLDFGCGRGATVRALRAAGFDAYGADKFFGGMDWTSLHADDLVEQRCIRRIEADGRLPFPDGSFAFIVSDQVLEHVDDLEQVVRELKRVLAPGGRMYHQFPTREVIREAHFGLPYIHRMPPRLRWVTMYLLRRLGFGKHTAEAGTARQWATTKGQWLDDYCRYRPWDSMRAVFAAHGFTAEHRELEYCLYRAAGRKLLTNVLGFRPLRGLNVWLFRRLGFMAVEFTPRQEALRPAQVATLNGH